VEESVSGIYHVIGAKLGLAIQFICRKRLSGKDNLWLNGLGNDLGAAECARILAESEKRRAALGAYMDVALKANPKTMAEVMGMNSIAEMRKALGAVGAMQEWLAEVRAEGEARTRAERERMRLENERLKREITALKHAAHANA
jgi:hypothetical protein